MVLWTVDSSKIQLLCLLVGLVSATLGYLVGSHSQDQITRFLNKPIVQDQEGNS